jgi:hypothetical protein
MANYKYIKELIKYSSDELKLEYDISPKDWRFKLSDGSEYVGVEFSTELEGDSRIEELELLGWQVVKDMTLDYVYNEPLSYYDKRMLLINTLTSAAEASGLSVPFESFFYDNRKVVIDWILNGGDSLTKVFEESTEKWMDMRASEESPTPREYALNLLQ